MDVKGWNWNPYSSPLRTLGWQASCDVVLQVSAIVELPHPFRPFVRIQALAAAVSHGYSPKVKKIIQGIESRLVNGRFGVDVR